jgi:hypothetical protein
MFGINKDENINKEKADKINSKQTNNNNHYYSSLSSSLPSRLPIYYYLDSKKKILTRNPNFFIDFNLSPEEKGSSRSFSFFPSVNYLISSFLIIIIIYLIIFIKLINHPQNYCYRDHHLQHLLHHILFLQKN